MGFVPQLPDVPDRPLKRKAAIASTLIACLELARDGDLHLKQYHDWGTIEVSRDSGGEDSQTRDVAAADVAA